MLEKIFLGTANWGLSVSKAEAYRIISVFYQNGYRWIDTATNYPIKKGPQDFMACIGWLYEFLPDFPEINYFVKVGSATNLGNSDSLLSRTYFELIFENLHAKLGGNLRGIGVHWDHGVKNSQREDLIEFFAKIHKSGLKVGLSGIAENGNYSQVPEGKVLPWLYQINIYQDSTQNLNVNVAKLKNDFPNSKIYGYSIMGGNKKNEFGFTNKRPHNLSSLVKNLLTSTIDGVIIGPTNETQCEEWIEIVGPFTNE